MIQINGGKFWPKHLEDLKGLNYQTWRHVIRRGVTRHNDNQHNYTQHN